MADPLTRLGHDLGGDLRALDLTGPRANAALRSALTTVLAVLIALALNLDNPFWAGISGVVLVQVNRAATLTRSIDRVIGTVVGAAIGYLGAGLVANHFAFLALAAGYTGFVIYAQERAQHGYAFLLSGVTMVLIMFGSLATPDQAFALAVYRGFEILVGVSVACAVDYALAEDSQLAAVAHFPGVFAPPLDRELAAIAIVGGITMALIPVIWEALELPGLGQTPITAFMILCAMRKEPSWRAVTRAAGCLVGGIWGLLAMHFVGDSLVPWVFLLFIGLFLAAHINQGGGDASYVGMQAGIAIVITMVQGASVSPDFGSPISRLVGIFGGVIVVALCQPLFVLPARWLVHAGE